MQKELGRPGSGWALPISCWLGWSETVARHLVISAALTNRKCMFSHAIQFSWQGVLRSAYFVHWEVFFSLRYYCNSISFMLPLFRISQNYLRFLFWAHFPADIVVCSSCNDFKLIGFSPCYLAHLNLLLTLFSILLVVSLYCKVRGARSVASLPYAWSFGLHWTQ